MFSRPISLAVTFIGVGAIGWAVACSSDDSTATTTTNPEASTSGSSGVSGVSGTASGATGATGASNTTGSSGGTGATGSGTIPDSGTSGTPEGSTTAGNTVLIDDMSSPAGAQIQLPLSAVKAPAGTTAGYWYTYNDTTDATDQNGAPNPEYMGANGFTQFPVPKTAFAYTNIGGSTTTGTPEGGASDATVATTNPISVPSGATSGGVTISRAACTKGGPIGKLYGYAAEAFNFATTPAPGAAADSGVNNPVTVDASAYSGIQFWLWVGADASAMGMSVQVAIPDAFTATPQGTSCSNDAGLQCGDNFSFTPPAPTAGAWTLVSIPFTTMQQGTWGTQEPSASLDTAHVYGIQFQVSGPQMELDAGGTTTTFDFCVADLAFTK